MDTVTVRRLFALYRAHGCVVAEPGPTILAVLAPCLARLPASPGLSQVFMGPPHMPMSIHFPSNKKSFTPHLLVQPCKYTPPPCVCVCVSVCVCVVSVYVSLSLSLSSPARLEASRFRVLPVLSLSVQPIGSETAV